jgi:hypothetical protein
LAATTLRPFENFAEYRIRLSLPYILQKYPSAGATIEKHAVCQRVLRGTAIPLVLEEPD